MAICEMCGKGGVLVSAEIDGAELKVCPSCAKYGTIKKKVNPFFKPKSNNFQKEEPDFKIIDNYSDLIKSARENRNMNQAEFAKFLNERESIVSKWENGSLKPRLNVARKISRLLSIKMVEKDTAEKVEIEKKQKNDEFTLGDFIKVRKKK